MELLKESLEKKEVQISEVLKATNLDPSAMSSLTKRLEEVLGQKNTHIKELQYDLSKVTKVRLSRLFLAQGGMKLSVDNRHTTI